MRRVPPEDSSLPKYPYEYVVERSVLQTGVLPQTTMSMLKDMERF